MPVVSDHNGAGGSVAACALLAGQNIAVMDGLREDRMPTAADYTIKKKDW
jgi:hypothetical protein